MRNLMLRLMLGLPICLPLPALAEEPGSEFPRWLGAVGDFIQSGIEPARTLEDLLRHEEEQRRAAALPPPAEAEPETIPPPIPASLTDVDPGLGPEAGSEPEFEPVSPPPAPPPQMAAPQPVVAPPSRPLTASQPPQTVLPSFPPAPPISPADRIAGTATLDQALKLGGPADLYAHPIRRPSATSQ